MNKDIFSTTGRNLILEMYDATSQSFSLIPLFIHFIHSKPTGDIVLEFDWFDDNRLTTTKTLGFFPLLGK